MTNKLFKRKLINYYGNLPQILEKLDIEVQRNGLLFCPFHENYHTPAARLYRNEMGWCIWCFAEHRFYGTYDVYKDILNFDMDKVFDKYWEKLSEKDREAMNDLLGEYNDTVVVADLEKYGRFRVGKITYKQLLDELINTENT